MSKSLENFDIADYKGGGKNEIPELDPVHEFTATDFWRLNIWNKAPEPSKTCLHSYIDDYRFNSVWTHPEKWIDRLKEFDSVLVPDFSLYTDMPYPLQLWNHYRKHWVGRYWADNGIKVIPNIAWSTKESYDWCFEGEPKHSVVAVSSIGAVKSKDAKALFLEGFYEMKKRLEPVKIVFYGTIPKELENEDIIHIPHFFNTIAGGTDAVK